MNIFVKIYTFACACTALGALLHVFSVTGFRQTKYCVLVDPYFFNIFEFFFILPAFLILFWMLFSLVLQGKQQKTR